MKKVHTEISNLAEDSDANTLWSMFRDSLNEGIEKFVPQKNM
jgi:hypothetical protein